MGPDIAGMVPVYENRPDSTRGDIRSIYLLVKGFADDEIFRGQGYPGKISGRETSETVQDRKKVMIKAKNRLKSIWF